MGHHCYLVREAVKQPSTLVWCSAQLRILHFKADVVVAVTQLLRVLLLVIREYADLGAHVLISHLLQALSETATHGNVDTL